MKIPRIDVNDELSLREVFFGEGHGQSYVVLCNTPPKEDDPKAKPSHISSVFQDAMDEISNSNKDQVQFVLMDCTHTLPTSGKTIAQKFKLDLKQRPSIFISSPKLDSNVPKQIPSKHLKTGHMLAKVVKQMLLPHTQKIESSKDIKNKCLNASYCALLLKGATPDKFLKDAIHNLLQKYGDGDDLSKKVTFASVDSSTLYITGLEEHLPEFSKGTNRFVVFKKVSGGIKEGDTRLITSIASLGENESLTHNSMEDLMTQVMNGSGKGGKMKKLSSLPQVKTRTKKLEAAERAKRQRKVDAKKEKEDKAKQPHTGENDGSKEGRKAERERRREEHRKNNPNYKQKTPEEIAEMERKRRQRMEEESKKWNMEAEEDLPPEGEPIDDGEYDEYDMDEEDGDEEEEDDEDIMDLD